MSGRSIRVLAAAAVAAAATMLSVSSASAACWSCGCGQAFAAPRVVYAVPPVAYAQPYGCGHQYYVVNQGPHFTAPVPFRHPVMAHPHMRHYPYVHGHGYRMHHAHYGYRAQPGYYGYPAVRAHRGYVAPHGVYARRAALHRAVVPAPRVWSGPRHPRRAMMPMAPVVRMHRGPRVPVVAAPPPKGKRGQPHH